MFYSAFYLSSCRSKAQPQDSLEIDTVNSYYKSSKYTPTMLFELLDSAIVNGDGRLYYNSAADYTLYYGRDYDILYYSLIMANKYNYPPAYFNVYKGLTHSNTVQTLDDVDESTKNLALYYLTKGAEYGDKSCITLINGELRREGYQIENSSDYYLEKFK